ncbi:MAG: hypothetical protein ACOYYS_10815 [Chloroflexota bacterium]
MSQSQTKPLMQFIPFDEALLRLQVSREELMHLVDGCAIKGYRYGKEIYLDLGEVEALLRSPAAPK